MPTKKIRRSQLDGQWYPAVPGEVRAAIELWRPYIEDGEAPGGAAKSAIIPHAGWVFSGKLAAKTIWRAVQSLGAPPELVVVLGGHLRPGEPIVVFDDDFWSTPLGHIPIASELNARLAGKLEPRHWYGSTDDNTIEVQLPLVRHFCPEAALWPLRVASGPLAAPLGELMAELIRERPTLILASTDLTHYGRAYGFAPAGAGSEGEAFREANDKAFIEAALKLDPGLMMKAGEERRAACSAGAAAAAVETAKLLSAEPELVDHYSSADIHPGPQSVGYAGILFTA